MDNGSLEATETAAAAVAKAPRISLDDIKNNIREYYFVTAAQAIGTVEDDDDDPLKHCTLCIALMKNGYIVIGKSAPASPENFNAELGKNFAFDDAVRQIWPLMGFALREKLAELPHP